MRYPRSRVPSRTRFASRHSSLQRCARPRYQSAHQPSLPWSLLTAWPSRNPSSRPRGCRHAVALTQTGTHPCTPRNLRTPERQPAMHMPRAGSMKRSRVLPLVPPEFQPGLPTAPHGIVEGEQVSKGGNPDCTVRRGCRTGSGSVAHRTSPAMSRVFSYFSTDGVSASLRSSTYTVTFSSVNPPLFCMMIAR